MTIIQHEGYAEDQGSKALVSSFLTLSTAHFSPADDKILTALASGAHNDELAIYVHRAAPGYIIRVFFANYFTREAMLKRGLSLAFVDLMAYVSDNDHAGVLFDGDADICDHFHAFEWP